MEGPSTRPFGPGVVGAAVANVGVMGQSVTNVGVMGRSANNMGVVGASDGNVGVYGHAEGGRPRGTASPVFSAPQKHSLGSSAGQKRETASWVG